MKITIVLENEDSDTCLVHEAYNFQDAIMALEAWIGVLSVNKNSEKGIQRTRGSFCPKGHLLFSDGMCPRCERYFPTN